MPIYIKTTGMMAVSKGIEKKFLTTNSHVF